ncbi:MAG: type II toxin-antitoxin system Phd/YefM family antitoxin [Candidatus Marinimicrobia bacterium]|nr:type II toxin-antitoxin system Phd/YefM family antitoxin [Candidatus Neomarinimicrobiota bacterium]
MNTHITANELKTKGISYLDELTVEQDEMLVTVHGKEKYVILTVKKYNELRELELEAAVNESRADYKAGRVHDDSVSEHIDRIING